jgi:nucleolar protein 56
MYLITKWFGVFVCDSDKIQKKILFQKNGSDIVKHLEIIKSNGILEEENTISDGLNLVVNEKRLQQIGKYQPDYNWFKSYTIASEDFGFSKDLLQQVSIMLAKDKIFHLLSAKDLQIIQMMNALDELKQSLNLFSERMNYWSVLPNSEEKITPFKEMTVNMNKEVSRLEQQIQKDMTNLAPNISLLVGSLLGARLISLAGGLQKLAMMPASTVQLLGAEKALFRFKKEGGKPPKHGVIYQHVLINKSNKKVRGKIARVFALKIILAAKADVFTKRDISQNLVNDLSFRVDQIKKSK